jgi:hypothetical protein
LGWDSTPELKKGLKNASHNLNIENGVASRICQGEIPWYKLGTKLDEPTTASEAILTVGFEFHVEKMYLNTEFYDLPITDYFCYYPDGYPDFLGVVGTHYTPKQNKDVFTVFDVLVGEGHESTRQPERSEKENGSG